MSGALDELRKRDIRILCTSHLFRHYTWSVPNENNPKQKQVLERGLKEKWDIFDPRYNHIYQNKYNGIDYTDYRKDWQRKITEVIDKYHPDILWFDGDIHGGVDFPEPLAHYFNEAEKRGQEVVVCNKYPIQDPGLDADRFNFPSKFGWVNFEQGRDRPVHIEQPFCEDFTITGRAWSYVGDDRSQSGKQVLRRLIDLTSRGGALILSLCPRADGTIPEAQQQALVDMGEWLEANGEAIFATRPWRFASDETDEETQKYIHTYSSKPNKRWHYEEMPEGSVRYTSSKDGSTVYVLTLGIPSGNEITAKRLAGGNSSGSGKISRVTLLDCEEAITWRQTEQGLQLSLPGQLPSGMALAFKVEMESR